MKQNKGSVLVQVVVIGFVSVSVAAAAYTLIGRTFQSSAKLEHLQTVLAIRQTVENYVDCYRTLSNIPAGSKTLILKKRGGRTLTKPCAQNKTKQCLGNWEITVERSKDALIVKTQSMDTVIKKYFGQGKSVDIFFGKSKLCSSYFTQVCPLKDTQDTRYNIYAGSEGDRTPKCCRIPTIQAAEGSSTLSCNPNEYLIHGGGWCTPGPDYPQFLNAQGALNMDGVKLMIKGKKYNRNLFKTSIDAGAITTATGGPSSTPMPEGFMPHKHSGSFPVAFVGGGQTPGNMEDKTTTLGGFMHKTAPIIEPQRKVVNSWNVQCQTNDWIDSYGSVAWGLCCPMKIHQDIP